MANAQYLLESTEKRTIGLKNYGGKDIFELGHYYLMGETGKNALFPAANVLTQYLTINPYFHVEGLLGISFISDNFTFDFGYNLFYKDKEGAQLKDTWIHDKYALAAEDFDSSNAFNTAIPANTLNNAGAISSEHLDLRPAISEAALTNKIYVALGYSFNDWEMPWMIGIGGGYEFHSGNSALENVELWLKTSLSF